MDLERRPRPASWLPARLRWLAWGAYVVLWSAALLTPYPVEVADAVLPPETHFLSAKTLHVAAYAGLTILSGWLGVSSHRRVWLLLFVSAHGFATEYLQTFVPMRYPSWADAGFDHIGIVLGLLVSWKWWQEPVRP